MSPDKPYPLWTVAASDYANAQDAELWTGCDFGCRYCLPVARKWARRFEVPRGEGIALTKVEPRTCDPLNLLSLPDNRSRLTRLRIPPLFLSLLSDPYPAREAQDGLTRRAIRAMHAHGIGVRVLTKSGTRAVRDFQARPGMPLQRLYSPVTSLDDLDPSGPAQLGSHPDDAFGATVSLLDASESRKWEPRAATPEERIAGLQEAHARGIPTWCNIMPVIDQEQALEIVRRTHAFVDLYQVAPLEPSEGASPGRPWPVFAERIVALCREYGVSCFVRIDPAAQSAGGGNGGCREELTTMLDALLTPSIYREMCQSRQPAWRPINPSALAAEVDEAQQAATWTLNPR